MGGRSARLATAMGYPMNYAVRLPRSWTRSPSVTPTFAGVSFEKLDELGSRAVAVQRQGAGGHADHACRRLRARQGPLHDHRIRADARAHQPLLPADPHHRPHPVSQYNVGAQTRRTDNVALASRRTCSRSIRTTPRLRGIRRWRRWSRSPSRIGATTLRAVISERMPQGVVYTTFHHPVTGANVITTEYSDWATNCPEYKVTAVQVTLVQPAFRMAEGMGGAREREQACRGQADDRGGVAGDRPPAERDRCAVACRVGDRQGALSTAVSAALGRSPRRCRWPSCSIPSPRGDDGDPADLEDFAVGFALAEGILASATAVLGVIAMPVENGVTVDVVGRRSRAAAAGAHARHRGPHRAAAFAASPRSAPSSARYRGSRRPFRLPPMPCAALCGRCPRISR